MTKFSDFIRFPGTAGPPTRDGVKNLGFVLDADLPSVLEKYVRVDVVQSFSSGEKAQGRANIGAVIGTDVQAFSASLSSLAGLTTSANQIAYTTAADTWAVTTLTAFARTLLDDATAGAARTTLGVVIGTDVQAFSAALTSIAGLTTAADHMPYTTASNTYAVTTLTPFARTILDDADASTARATLGAISSVVRRVFTASGTYTPTPGMAFCDIEAVGGGAGGGGTTASSANSQASAGGGGGGEYSRKQATAADIGASKPVVVGTAGTGGAAGNNAGTAGGDSSVGALCVAKGGQPGLGNSANSGSDGGAGGTGGVGDILIPGADGGDGGGGTTNTVDSFSGAGGASHLGAGGKAIRATSRGGSLGKNYGGGGSGGMDRNASAARGGGNGAPGIVIITEYII